MTGTVLRDRLDLTNASLILDVGFEWSLRTRGGKGNLGYAIFGSAIFRSFSLNQLGLGLEQENGDHLRRLDAMKQVWSSAIP